MYNKAHSQCPARLINKDQRELGSDNRKEDSGHIDKFIFIWFLKYFSKEDNEKVHVSIQLKVLAVAGYNFKRASQQYASEALQTHWPMQLGSDSFPRTVFSKR